MSASSNAEETSQSVRERLAADDHFFGKLIGSAVVGVLALTFLAAIVLHLTLKEREFDRRRAAALSLVRDSNQLETLIYDVESLKKLQSVTGVPGFDVHLKRRIDILRSQLDGLKTQPAEDPEFAKTIEKVRGNLESWIAQSATGGVVAGMTTGSASANSGVAQSGTGSATIATAKDELLGQAADNLAKVREDALKKLLEFGRQEQVMDVSFQALISIPRLKGLISQMEQAEWGWLFTQNRSFADENRNAWGLFNAYYGHLSVLLADNVEQQRRLGGIKDLVEKWQREIAAPEFASRQSPAEAAQTLSKNRSRETLDSIRALVAEMEREQNVTFEGARNKLEWRRLLSAAGAGFLCIVALAVSIVSSLYSYKAYQRQLRKATQVEEQTRSILESTLDAILVFSEHGTILAVNPAAEKMFGLEDKELIGRNISRLFPGQSVIKDIGDKKQTVIAATANRQNIHAFPVEISVSEMPNEHYKQYVGLVRDVSERRRSEETLRHVGVGISAATGEEFLRLLVKQLSKALQAEFGFVMEIPRTGSQTMATLTLSEKGQIRNLPRFALEDSFCSEVLKQGFLAVETDAARNFPEDDLLKDLAIESFVATQLVDHRGKPAGILGVMSRSVSEWNDMAESSLRIFAARAAAEIERKRFAEDLAAEKERLAITLRSIGDGFIATDVDGRVMMMNAVAEKLTGWAQDAAAGKGLSEVFRIYNERTRSFAENAIQRIVETGSAIGIANAATIVAQDGSQRLIETTASPIRDKGNRKIGIVLVFKDVTERQRLEEEHRKAEKLESLGVAAGGIAHDFNNLLTAIIGNLSLALMDMPEGEDLTERVTTAKKASLRAQDLAQQLLTFAKGGAPIKKSASIGQMVQDTVKFSLRGSNIRSEFAIDPDLWIVEVDAGQISQVITNLTVNAEQAMPAGGTIRIECKNVELDANCPPGLRPGRFVRLTVQDEGIGIPEDYLQKIFDPYFTTKPKGSGLGLATAYSIIKNHDGLITVDSAPGEGTAFHLFLPASEKAMIAQATETASPSAPAIAKSTPVAGSRGRVLVLDDEEVICTLVVAALSSLGYEVTPALDASSAIRAYEVALREGKKFDAVITDLTIPGGMGGLDAVKILRQMDPDVKAIVSSGYATDPVMSRYREYGFVACIAKPYEVAALGHVVNEVLSASKETQVFHDFVQAELA